MNLDRYLYWNVNLDINFNCISTLPRAKIANFDNSLFCHLLPYILAKNSKNDFCHSTVSFSLQNSGLDLESSISISNIVPVILHQRNKIKMSYNTEVTLVSHH